MFKKQIASKEQVKLMIGLAGPSGSGKTYSALQLAFGITKDWSKITLADTENRSALYYAGEKTGPWQHVDFPPTVKGGYHPENWMKLIEYVEQDLSTEVLILDSISHEWQGTGGCLQLIEAYSKNAKGNTFTPWKIVTPLHNAFVDKIRNSRLHIIATMRTSTEYSMEQNSQGKTTPKKIGTKPTQREGTDYEFGIIFDIEIEHHHAITSKDRTGLFAGKPPFLITSEIGKELVEWAKDGELPKVPEGPHIFSKNSELSLEKLQTMLKEGRFPEEIWPEIEENMDGKVLTSESLYIACKGPVARFRINRNRVEPPVEDKGLDEIPF